VLFLGTLQHTHTRFRVLLRNTHDDQLTAPTPCEGWDVRTLLDHTIATMGMFAAAASRENAPPAHDVIWPTDVTTADILATFEAASAAELAAWARLDAMARTLTTAFGAMPAVDAMRISTFSTLVHGWDLAVSTGQDGELTPDLVAAARRIGDVLAPQLRPTRQLADEQELDRDATDTERLMAFLGRRVPPRRAWHVAGPAASDVTGPAWSVSGGPTMR
jgi:uncharacterized protein (TIGR03086 family)